MCIVFESTLSDNTRHDFSGHYKRHQVEIKEKLKFLPGSEFEKKENIIKTQNLFAKRSCESLAMLDACNKIAFV